MNPNTRLREQVGMSKVALILAPHPDDESIIGLLPLRLQEECGFSVWVIPATLGSLRARQPARRRELRAACRTLGFQLHFLNSARSEKELAVWLKKKAPDLILMPHAQDGHPTHRATHGLGRSAMDAAGGDYHVVETEYWHPLARPNLMVAAGRRHLDRLRRALACHAGEVARNDYAARLPAWMSDNVRRGAERIGSPGARAPRISHATLYRARLRTGGKWRPEFRGGRVIKTTAELAALADFWAQ